MTRRGSSASTLPTLPALLPVLTIALVVAALLPASVRGDAYIQNPRGSNNKLHETQNNVRNDNRLFDSQNNANAGFQVGDACTADRPCSNANGNTYDKTQPGAGLGTMKFYQRSLLRIEWTVQHGCGTGNPWVKCQVVLQYMCDDDDEGTVVGAAAGTGIRDGTRIATVGGGQNDNGGNTNDGEAQWPNKAKDTPEYGRHESYDHWLKCRARERNKGLWTANQLPQTTTRQTAIHTRQNNNGQRFGFECPEERDYYPYWHPTPWRDIAVLTDEPARCHYYQTESENVASRHECVIAGYECETTKACKVGTYNNANNPDYNTKPVPNNEKDCLEWESKHPGQKGTWKETSAWGSYLLGDAPECRGNEFSRINHHGNTKTGRMAHYDWDIPTDVQGTCVLRLRYNITTGDFDGFNTFAGSKVKVGGATNPAKDWLGLGYDAKGSACGAACSGPLRMNVNTAQFGRTFEDRTHVFKILPRPTSNAMLGSLYTIYNFNVRGRRGNIQQTFPAVEYDFVWAGMDSHLRQGDYLHIQWTGSDANAAGNAGNGRQMTDRSNMVQIASPSHNAPMSFIDPDDASAVDLSESMFNDQDLVRRLAYLSQTGCDDTSTNTNELTYCRLLNGASAYQDFGLVQLTKLGTFHFMSSRNNAFSNRGQKATIKVRINDRILALVLGIFGTLAASVGTAMLCYVRLPAFVLMHPKSCCARTACGRRAKRRALRQHRSVRDKLRRQATEQAVPLNGDKGADAAAAAAATTGQEKVERVVEAALKGSASAERGCWRCCCGCRQRLTWDSDRYAWFCAYVAANVALFLFGLITHSPLHPNRQVALEMESAPPLYMWAKAGGATLNLNCAFIVVPMLKNLISLLRTTPVKDVVPLDDALWWHKIMFGGICVGLCFHVPAHYYDFVWADAHRGESFLVTAFFSRAGLTGHIIFVAMAAMAITALDCCRRRRGKTGCCGCGPRCCGCKRCLGIHVSCCGIGYYPLFLNVHQLWMLCFLCLFLHGPVFWIWALPWVLFMAAEKYIAARRAKLAVKLLEVRQHPGDVMELRCRLRAHGGQLQYKAGQYMMLQCPEISDEWHPFTLSSAPEDREFFSFHIRCRKGMDWCCALHDRLNPGSLDAIPGVDPPVRPSPRQSASVSVSVSVSNGNGRPLSADLERLSAEDFSGSLSKLDALAMESGTGAGRNGKRNNGMTKARPRPTTPIPSTLRINGPFGSASEDWHLYDDVVLVAAGIGVTPFAAVLRSMVARYRIRAALCAARMKGYGAGRKKKVYFFWLCRNLQEFDQFAMLLRRDVAKNASLDVELKLYMTGETEITSTKFQQEMRSMGKWASLYTGRPNWNKHFKAVGSGARERLESFRKGHVVDPHDDSDHGSVAKVGVFLCGPPAIGVQLGAACRAHTDWHPDLAVLGGDLDGDDSGESESATNRRKVMGGSAKKKGGERRIRTAFSFHKENF